jgi:hypothetical protein
VAFATTAAAGCVQGSFVELKWSPKYSSRLPSPSRGQLACGPGLCSKRAPAAMVRTRLLERATPPEGFIPPMATVLARPGCRARQRMAIELAGWFGSSIRALSRAAWVHVDLPVAGAARRAGTPATRFVLARSGMRSLAVRPLRRHGGGIKGRWDRHDLSGDVDRDDLSRRFGTTNNRKRGGTGRLRRCPCGTGRRQAPQPYTDHSGRAYACKTSSRSVGSRRALPPLRALGAASPEISECAGPGR